MDVCLLTCARLFISILDHLGATLMRPCQGREGRGPVPSLRPVKKTPALSMVSLALRLQGWHLLCVFMWFPGPQNYQKTVKPKGKQWFWGVAPTLQNFRLGKEIYFSKRFHDVDVIALKSHNLLIPDIVKVQWNLVGQRSGLTPDMKLSQTRHEIELPHPHSGSWVSHFPTRLTVCNYISGRYRWVLIGMCHLCVHGPLLALKCGIASDEFDFVSRMKPSPR